MHEGPAIHPNKRALHRLPLLIAGVVICFYVGLYLREWAWDVSRDQLRMPSDLRNAWRQGAAALAPTLERQSGGGMSQNTSWRRFFQLYRDRYATVEASAVNGDYRLNYPPLRLLIVCLWVKWSGGAAVEFSEELAKPMLHLNTLCEIISCAILIRMAHVMQRGQVARCMTEGSINQSAPRCLVLSYICGVILWFNPAMLLIGHTWPQWDVWLVPFYLYAALSFIRRRDFACGLAIGIGAAFKGQILLAAPVFILAPVWHRDVVGAVKCMLGIAAAAVALSFVWNGLVVNVIVLAAFLSICAIVVTWRMGCESGADNRRTAMRGILVAAAVAVGLWGAANGSYSWIKIGYLYGTIRTEWLHAGTTYNLAALLQDCFGFRLYDSINIRINGVLLVLTLRVILIAAFCVCVVVVTPSLMSCRGRNASEAGVCLVAPFLVAYMLLPQMHERYLVYPSIVSAICVIGGRISVLIHVMLTLLATVAVLDVQLGRSQPRSLSARLLTGGYPLFLTLSVLVLVLLILKVVRIRRID